MNYYSIVYTNSSTGTKEYILYITKYSYDEIHNIMKNVYFFKILNDILYGGVR